MTRIDVAIDLASELDPIAHADTVDVRSKTVITSDVGSTLYIGSRKSNTFARVYRYNEPHDRAGVTRIEVEFKGNAAKTIAAAIADGRMDEIAAFAARKTKTTQLEDWHMDHNTKPIKVNVDKKQHSGQDGWQRWMRKAALPSVVKAINEGTLYQHEIDRILDAIEYSDAGYRL